VFEQTEAVARDLVNRLNMLFEASGVPFFAYHFGNRVRIELTAPHAVVGRDDAALARILERRDILSRYMIPVAKRGRALPGWGATCSARRTPSTTTTRWWRRMSAFSTSSA